VPIVAGCVGQPYPHGVSTRSRRRIADRQLHATFDSPRVAVEAITRLRRELPGLSVELRPLGDAREGNEPDRIAVVAPVPWRWSRAAVMLLVGIDATARLEWDEAGVEDQATTTG
jgi:hypothetical protein